MISIASVEAIVGAGLSGDRYCAGVGFYSPRPTEPGAREVTLIEVETLERLQREHGLTLAPTDHRRNVTTRGVRLRELLNQRFRIGEVVLEGVKDCPPCEHLELLVSKPVMRPLLESGGIRARVVVGGTLRVGEEITQLRRAAVGSPRAPSARSRRSS
jgi:MOSC domain-containing protein YiiM